MLAYTVKRVKVNLVAMIVASASVLYATTSTAGSFIYAYDTENNSYTHESSTGAVSLNYPSAPNPFDQNVAYVDAATQTLRTYARADGSGGSFGKVAKTYASFNNTLTVGAGTSGLDVGAPVTLTLKLRADGRLGVGSSYYLPGYTDGGLGLGTFTPYDESNMSLSTVDIYGLYRIKDPNRLVCGEGCSPEVLMDFGFGGTAYDSAQNWNYISTHVNPGNWDYVDPEHNGYRDTIIDLSWDISNNQGNSLYGSYSYDQSCFAVDNCGEIIGPWEIPNSTFHYFDTGVLSMDFDTYVGAELEIESVLDIFPQAYGLNGPALAIGDFRNTMNGTIDSPYVEGIALTYAVTTPVPEPSIVQFFATGILTLAVLARRRKISKSNAEIA